MLVVNTRRWSYTWQRK